MKSKELKALNVAIDTSNTTAELKENTPLNISLNMDIVKKMFDNVKKKKTCMLLDFIIGIDDLSTTNYNCKNLLATNRE